MNTVIQQQHQQGDEQGLAEKAAELGLVKRLAFVPDAKAKGKSAGALRIAKHREKKKEAGLVPVDLPKEVADEIKQIGVPAFVDRIKPLAQQVIIQPTSSDPDLTRLLELGRKLEKLPKLLRMILRLT